MTWDLKNTIEGGDGAAGATSTKEPARPKKRSRSRSTRQADATAGARRDAGIVLHSAATLSGPRLGSPPELLYGNEYDCAFCHGTGQWPNESVCPVCRGSGKVSVPAPAVRCAFCKGKGRKTAGNTVTCLVCRGRGVVAVTPPVQVCPECKGRGKERGQSLYCSRCRGTGVVTSPRQSTNTGNISTDIGTEPKLRRKAS